MSEWKLRAGWAAWCVAAAACAAEQAAPSAREILDATGVSGGLIVHVGCGEGRLTAGLRADGRYVVCGLATDAAQVARARRTLAGLGLYGPVTVEAFDGRSLPFVDETVNLLVGEELYSVAPAEVMRVLCPRGVAYVRRGGRWEKRVKPLPADIDEWTHWLHGPDGNPVARDGRVGPPRYARWIAEPRWQRHHELTPSLSAMVSAGGRLFAILNDAPPGIDGLPDRWVLLARDAFNGKLLWKRPIPEWGWKQWSDHSYGHGRWNQPTHIARRMVAVGDRLYVTLGYRAPLSELDAATGRTLRTFPGTERTDEVLFLDGKLILAVNETDPGPGHIKDRPAPKKAVLAVEAAGGKVLWRTGGLEGAVSKADAIERNTHLMMVAGSGGVFCVGDREVVALEMATGRRLWRRDRGERPRPVTYGSYYFTNLASLLVHEGTVLLLEPDPRLRKQAWNAPAAGTLAGIDAATGRTLWTRPCGIWGHYNPGDIFVVGGAVWVHEPKGFAMMALEPRTGRVLRSISTKTALDQGHHHRCYRDKATERYFLTGRRGVEFIEPATGRQWRNHWVRGTCRYGVLPCNGLLYAPPHPCICYVTAKLTGFWALAGSQEQPPAAGPALVRGPAWGQAARGGPAPAGDDWPTYRHDPARSGCGGGTVPARLAVAWKAKVGPAPTAPVVAGGMVLAAARDAHTVVALRAADGQVAWRRIVGGRVDTPPTAWRGLALFGSADGWVHCVRLADGETVWRRRAAPVERRLLCRGRLESPWPVYGGVLVQDGAAYFTAGRSSFLDGGMTVFAVRPETGELLRARRLWSVHADSGDMGECRLAYDMPPDALGALPDVLTGDGRSVFLRHLRLDANDLAVSSAAEGGRKNRRLYPAVGRHLMAVAGMLDDSWFNQTYWTIDGKAHAKLLVFDERSAYGVKPYPGAARHSRAIFRPGQEGYRIVATTRPDHAVRWDVRLPVRVRAMALAGGRLFAAGSPDVVDPKDPWRAIDGRAGGVLCVLSAADGKKLAEYRLEQPPVFDGLAAAGGRLYVSTNGGEVVCLSAADRAGR